jgi:hypothetical protein
VPCKDLNLNLENLSVSKEELEESICADLGQGRKFGGSFQKLEQVTHLDIFVSPCA